MKNILRSLIVVLCSLSVMDSSHAQWTQTNGPYSGEVKCFAVSSTNLFAGNQSGVLLSTNNGTSWSAVNSGLTDLLIYSLTVGEVNLFAGTSRYGVFRRPLSEMVTSVQRVSSDLPTHFSLEQNYPNPFNPSTEIQLSIPSTSFVSLKIFNVLGAEIASLLNENKTPGTHQVTWDARGYPSGVYLYRLIAGGNVFSGKMDLLK